MVQELVKESVESVPPAKPGAQARIILKFFVIWLSALAALVVIALLTNIEWARRHIETALCQSFHRQVRLGRLSWSFGLHGLSIDSDRFVMKEKDGSPFISSGPFEIGLAFLPLFQKRLVIKHLQFDHPEVMAVRLDDKHWNFSDLISDYPEIHMVQIENGVLHLRNQRADLSPAAKAEQSWQSYDLKDLKLSATLPSHDRSWPLFLSCKIPLTAADGKAYESSVRLSTTGRGLFKEWAQNKYNIDLQLQNFEPARFPSFYAGMPPIKGRCNLHFKGEGVFTEGFAATASGTVLNLKICGAENKELELAQAQASCNLLINPAAIEWKDLKLSLADWQLNSNGKLSNWQKETPSYEAKVGGKLNDLKGFFNKVISCFLPEQISAAHKKFADSKLEKISKAQTEGQLSGSATIELRLAGNKQEQNVFTDIKAEGIPLCQLIDDELGSNFTEAFKINPSAPIRGELNINPGKRLEVKNLEIPLEDSKVKLNGFLDGQTSQCEFDFVADNLSFDSLKKRLGSNNELLKAFTGGGNKNRSYALSGKLDVKGKYKSDGKTPQIFIDSTLKGMRLQREDASGLGWQNIRGKLVYDNGTVLLKQLSGVHAGSASGPSGDFLLNGNFHLDNSRLADLDLHAHNISIAQLKDWLDRGKIKLSKPGLDKISGDLHELKAHISMHEAETNLSFAINPSDLICDLSGQANDGPPQLLKASSGTISYANNEFSAKDVILSGHGGKLTVSGSMKGSLDTLKLSWAHMKTDGFELGDLRTIMRGIVTPNKVNAILPEFMTPNPPASLHGKIYGDMGFVAQQNGTGISGVVGFNNAGGKFGKSQVSVDKLSGVAVITKDQLVLEETSGQIGKSLFSLDGVINNWATAAYGWQGQLRGQFFPDEVDTIMVKLGHGIELNSLSPESLNLRVTGSGEKGSASCSFRGKASATYGLSLKTAFGTFHQPRSRPLFFHGGLNLNEADSQISLNNFQLTSASEHLQASGTFKWTNGKEEKPASLSFALSTPAPVKTATLMEIVSQDSPANIKQIGGTSQLNLKVEGPVNDLVLSGSIALDKNSIPSVHLENLSGKMDLPGWHLSQSGDATSIARLKLGSLSLGGLALHEAGATLCLDSSKKIMVKDFQAALSGGKLTLSGFYNPESQSYHADINVSKLVVDEFVKDLIDHSGGVTGLADITLSLDNSNVSPRNLNGSGRFNIYQGSVASFGKLQEKLNESNLLQQGLFGFNVNNLLQAMMPVKSGQFNEVSGKLRIGKGNICFDQLHFEGTNLRMRAAGKFDFLERHVELDVAGDIPRVSSSIIPGAIGEMSRKVTLQRMFSIVTFRKLKDLPALPLLGDIANDDPRAFTFSVTTPTEPPKLMTQAVEKSFKWLPNKPFASAHPVPGI